MGAVPFNDAKKLAANPDLMVTTKGHEMFSPVSELLLNTERELLKDKRVRQAIAHAMQRQFIIDNIWFGYATPLFWAGLMLILVFSVWLDWFPTSGMENVVMFYEGWDRVVDIAHHLVLPAITLSLFYLALYTRLMRATMLEQRGLDYVTTARAKGLTERQITFRRVLRNALLPVITMAGVQVGALLGGSVVVESVFAWPGLGQLAFEALFSRDFNLLLGIFFISACLVVFVNIVVDVIYVLLDPRIKVDE